MTDLATPTREQVISRLKDWAEEVMSLGFAKYLEAIGLILNALSTAA